MKRTYEYAGSVALALALPVLAGVAGQYASPQTSASTANPADADKDIRIQSEITEPLETGTALPMSQSAFRATDLIGKPIQDTVGMTRGNVKDVILSEDRQRVEYVAVALTDAPDKYFQVPLADIRLVPDHHAVTFDVSASTLATRQSFARDAWPAGHDQRRLSAMMDMEVRNAAGETVGRIRDATMRSDTGAIDEATLGMGGMLGVGEKFASLDWKELTFRGEQNYARTDVAADQLKGRAYSKDEYWQRLGFGDVEESLHEIETPPAPPSVEEAPEATQHMPEGLNSPSATDVPVDKTY